MVGHVILLHCDRQRWSICLAQYQFSRRTIIAAITVLERMTQAELSRFLLELGPDMALLGDGSVKKRLNNIIVAVDQRPDRPIHDGGLLRDALVDKAITLIPSNSGLPSWMQEVPHPDVASFIRALELDGFTITNGVLRRILPVAAELPQAE